MHKLILIDNGSEANSCTLPNGRTLPNSNNPVLVLVTVKSTTCGELALLVIIIVGVGINIVTKSFASPADVYNKGFMNKVAQILHKDDRSEFKTAVYNNLVIDLIRDSVQYSLAFPLHNQHKSMFEHLDKIWFVVFRALTIRDPLGHLFC